MNEATLREPAGYLISGQYYWASGNSQAGASTAANAHQVMRCAPFFVPNNVTITRIGCEVTGAGEAGSKVRLGLYADTGTYYPGSLVLDAGQIDGTSATVQEITVAQALTAGMYWVAAVTQAAATTPPTLRINTVVGPTQPPIPIGSTIPGSGASHHCVFQSAVSGALPATFTTTPAGTNSMPRVFVKIG